MPIRFNPPVTWRRDDPLAAEKLNAMMRGVVRGITVGPGLVKRESPDGSRVAIALGTPLSPGREYPSVVATADTADTKGGKYLGALLRGASTATAGAADLALPEGMTAGDPCLILHTPEDGLPTHWIELGTEVVGKVVGRTAAGADPEADPARWIVVTGAGTYRTDGSTLAAGTGTDANTDTWDRTRVTSGTDYGDGGVTRTYVERVVWDGTAKKLYQFTRDEVLDASGRSVSISAETRTEIDAAEDCP